MHRISKIRVQNFKSIKDGEFPLSLYTPLVGYNNAGKTNILQSLSWIIKKSSLQASEFFDLAQPVTVTAEISGVDVDVLDALGGQHRLRIEPFIVDNKISIRRTQTEPGQALTTIRFEVLSGTGEWVVNPNGIDTAISNLFPEPISIGAMENATDDVGKYAAGTTIGKLIKEIVDDVASRNAGQVTAALADVASRLSADGLKKDPKLVDLDSKIQTELMKFFPGVTAKTHIQVPDFGDFLKSATVKIYDNQFDNAIGRDASSFGHGAQRSVQIALIKCLSEIKRAAAANARTTLLLIDEPELYLHPQAIELVRAALSRLSIEGYQVVFSTHSANMIARSDAENVLLIRRSSADGTKAIPRLQDAVRQTIEDVIHQSETLFLLSNSVKLLFCEKLLLAEGKTERVLLPDLFSHEHGISFDEDKIGLLELGGSGNVPGALKVLAAMGTPTKAVVDLDFVFKVAPQAGMIQENHTALIGCKSIFARLATAGLVHLNSIGLPEGSSTITAAAAFALMAAEPDASEHIDDLHNHMLGQRIWVWKRGAIEAHLGLAAKSSSAHIEFLTKVANTSFRTSLPDYAAVQAMFAWARLP